MDVIGKQDLLCYRVQVTNCILKSGGILLTYPFLACPSPAYAAFQETTFRRRDSLTTSETRETRLCEESMRAS